MNLVSSLRLAAAVVAVATVSTNSYAANTAPKPVKQNAPAYAFDLRKEEAEGAVVVAFSVSPEGTVSKARVLSSTHRVFEEAALAAVEKWSFAPATRDGVAVESTVEQLVTFTVPWKTPQTSRESLVAALVPRSQDRFGNCGDSLASLTK